MEDVIDDKVDHKLNSLKIVRIDGVLVKKQKWNGLIWEFICRYPDCKESLKPGSKNLCEVHYSLQMKNSIKGEIVKRGSQRFKWNSKKWNLICSNETCTNYTQKNGRCPRHIVDDHASLDAVSMFNQIKDSIEVKNKKMVRTRKPIKDSIKDTQINTVNIQEHVTEKPKRIPRKPKTVVLIDSQKEPLQKEKESLQKEKELPKEL